MAFTYDTCPWPVDEACLPAEWEAMDTDLKDRSIALASATLHRLTGYRVGGCPITVRPCKPGCAGTALSAYTWAAGGHGMWPMNFAGTWVNSCGCHTDCSCTTLCEIRLPEPVGDIVEVKLDGAVVPAADYRADRNSLVWTGAGDCPWPACQDLAADDGPGTFRVTYFNSYPVDGLGAYAAGVLAAEFAKACSGGRCRLPATVTTVSRQGVTYDVNAGTFPDGTTGIREVDAYIGMWNPDHLRQQTRVWSPDLRNPRVTR